MRRALIFWCIALCGAIAAPVAAAPFVVQRPIKPFPFATAPKLNQQYDYTTRFARTVNTEGAINVSGIVWNCASNECRTSGPWPVPGVGACNALALREGTVLSYGYPGRVLAAAELMRCNFGVASMASPAPVSAAGPPWNVTTAELSAIGGAAAAEHVVSGITITTGELSAIGGAMPPETAFTPITITTGELSAVGGE